MEFRESYIFRTRCGMLARIEKIYPDKTADILLENGTMLGRQSAIDVMAKNVRPSVFSPNMNLYRGMSFCGYDNLHFWIYRNNGDVLYFVDYRCNGPEQEDDPFANITFSDVLNMEEILKRAGVHSIADEWGPIDDNFPAMQFSVGNYETIEELCRKQNISGSVFRRKLKQTLNLEQALRLAKGTSPIAKPFTFRGVEYPSQTAAAKAFDLLYSTVLGKARTDKISYAEALEKLISRYVQYHGKWYKTKAQVYAEVGLKTASEQHSVGQLQKKYNMPFESAVDAVLNHTEPFRRKIKVDRKWYSSLEAACKDNGVNPGTIRRHLNAHPKDDPAATIQAFAKHGGRLHRYEFVFRGKLYHNRAELAEDYGISLKALTNRLCRKHMSLEEAVDDAVRSQKAEEAKGHKRYGCCPVQYHDKFFKTLRACCRELGVKEGMVSYRVRKRGMSYEKAIDDILAHQTQICKRADNRACPVIFRKKQYSSKNACYKEYGISGSAIRKRMQRYHMTWEQAMENTIQRRQGKCGQYAA